MTEMLSFLKLLELGVATSLATENVAISNYSKIEEAYYIGVLEYKKRLKKRRSTLPGLPDNVVPSLITNKFSDYVQDKVTGSFEIMLNPGIRMPAWYQGWELHMFLDNSAESYKLLLASIKHFWHQLSPREYATLELISDIDVRIPSAQLNYWGESGSIPSQIAERLDEFFDMKRKGHRVDLIYAPSTYQLCSLNTMGTLSGRQQAIFQILWLELHRRQVFYMEGFQAQYSSVIDSVKPKLFSFGTE